MTKKELFEKLYKDNLCLTKCDRRKTILTGMNPFFKTAEATENYVDLNLSRKQRNFICRRIRMCRKANLQEFNYFCTFTYDDKLHTEESFKKKLKTCYRHLCERKEWKYMGVWERSPEKNRLHFHGLFYIPEGAMPGELFEKDDYSFNTHKRQITVQNTYFNEHFGRSDFKIIEDRNSLGDAMAYLMKYIEKTGEKIVYSKGLPQYFITDIMEDDVITAIGEDANKLLLFDDFTCWDEGTMIGKVSSETIKKLRKRN